MKKSILAIVKIVIIVSLSISVLTLIDEGDFWSAYKSLVSVSALQWGGLFVCSGGILFVLSQSFLVSMRVVGTELSAYISFQFTSMNSFLNNVLPLKAGIAVRGLILKKDFNVNWGNYLFVVFSGQLFQLAFLFLMLLIALYKGMLPSFNLSLNIDGHWLTAIGAGFLVAAVLAYKFKNLTQHLVNKILHGYKLWIINPRLLVSYFLLIIMFHIFSGFRIWCSYLFVGAELDFGEIVTIYVILAIGMSWSVTPGNIGVKEAAIVFLSSVIGIESGIAIAASVVDRIASLAAIALLGGVSTYLLMKERPQA